MEKKDLRKISNKTTLRDLFIFFGGGNVYYLIDNISNNGSVIGSSVGVVGSIIAVTYWQREINKQVNEQYEDNYRRR